MLRYAQNRPRSLGTLLVLAALVAGLTACNSSSHETANKSAGAEYVALGDSYTGAPGIGTESTDGCLRSANNYPHLVATKMHVTLADHSCGSARTVDITGRQRTRTGTLKSAQIEALTESTRFVTLSIGANDYGLYNLLAGICPEYATTDPKGAPCTQANRALPRSKRLDSRLPTIRAKVIRILHTIRSRSPHARVVVVGYPSVLPEHGTCSQIAFAAGDVPLLRAAVTRLNRVLSTAASRTGATYVDLFSATQGHDVCSSDPWIAGAHPRPGAGVAWHPYEAEQKVAAQLVTAALRKS